MEKEFIVPFPSKVELDILVAIKKIPTDKNKGVLFFEEWSQEIKPKKKLHSMWVLAYGVLYEIRSFLPLWAIGSTLGATVKVDMSYMCKNGVVRLLVDVLDVGKIPNDTDIVFDGSIYPIYFKVDEMVSAKDDNFDDDDLLDDKQAHGEDQFMEDVDLSKNSEKEQDEQDNSRVQDQGDNVRKLSPHEEAALVQEAID